MLGNCSAAKGNGFIRGAGTDCGCVGNVWVVMGATILEVIPVGVADCHNVKSGIVDGGATLDSKFPLGWVARLGEGIEYAEETLLKVLNDSEIEKRYNTHILI